VVKQKFFIGISLCSLLVLAGCVSEQTYVGSDKPVSDRTFDNIEAARTRISLGLNYLRRGDTSQAKYNLERARSFAPNSAEVYSALAYYYQNVGENKQAEEYFRLAIAKDSNYADAYNNYGAFLCQLKRYEEAEQLLLKAISRPGYIRVAESYENLALCQLQQNHFNKANNYLDNSISHNSTRITSLTMSAGLAYAMGDNRQAKAQLDRIQRLGRVSARTVLLSYLIAEKNGDRETMRSAEQLLLTLYTETPETRLLLQGKLQENEFEQLRERYKDSLMANIVLPDENAAPAQMPKPPVANPKLKVVKRKTDDSSSADMLTPPAMTNTATDIASSLSSKGPSVAAPATLAQLPAEQIKADNQYTKQDADTAQKMKAEQEAAALAAAKAKQQAEQEAAALAAVEAKQLAEQEAAALAAVEAKQLAEQEAAAFAAAEAKKLAEQEAAAFAAAEAKKLAEQEAAALAAADAKKRAEQDAEKLAATSEPAAQDVETSMALALEQPLLVTDETQVAADNIDHAIDDAATTNHADQAQPKVDMTSAADATPFHIVQAAESLYAISVQHNIRLQRLMEWNQLTPDSVIKTGQKIWLGPVTEVERAEPEVSAREQIIVTEPYHTVVSGETMFGISYKYNIRLSSFMSWNNFTENSTLKVGQKVYVVDPVSITQ